MKIFFRVLKNFLEMLSWISGGLFFNTVDAVVFSGTATLTYFTLLKMAIFVVLYFTLKGIVEYMETEWDRVSSEEYKEAKKKANKKSKKKARKKLRFRDVKGFSKRNL